MYLLCCKRVGVDLDLMDLRCGNELFVCLSLWVRLQRSQGNRFGFEVETSSRIVGSLRSD